MFTRSIIRLTLALIIGVASLLFVTSITATAATTASAIARPRADLIVNPDESIQAAIDAANDGDTIIVNAGNYTESLTLSKPVSLTGVNSDTTIIHAIAGQRVLTVTGATISNSVVISGLTFTGGQALTGLYDCRLTCGGGILFIDNVEAVVINTIFYSNTAKFSGGGLYATGPILLSNVDFIGNTAFVDGGGANAAGTILVNGGLFRNNSSGSGGGLFAQSILFLTNTQFISNAAVGGGGGVYATGAATTLTEVAFQNNQAGHGGGLLGVGVLTLTSGQFLSNTAGRAGGAYIAGTSASAVNVLFQGNRATLYHGGGLVGGNIDLTLTDVQFLSNTAEMNGGGLYTVMSPTNVTGGLFQNNQATNGGGIYAYNALTVTKVQFISNTAQQTGGGIYQATQTYFTLPPGPGYFANVLLMHNQAVSGNGSALALEPFGGTRISHATIRSDSPQAGSAIYVSGGNVSITNTLITNHAIGIGNTGGAVTEDYNLFYSNTINRDGVMTGTHSLIGDPRFVDPAHDDYHLAFGSAAIDHGVDAGVYTDLDGNARPIGAGFDIGAYEFAGGTRYVATTGDDTSNLCLDQLAPCSTVQHAIDVAHDGEQVLIASGLYTQSTTLSKPVSLTGVNSDTTIIHAVAGQRVLTVTGATISNSVVISGLTFTGGYAGNGGGLYADHDVTLINMQFISNTAYWWPGGGGAYISAVATMTDSLFLSNTASNGGGVAVLGSASLVGCRFENNVANSVSGTGGGLYHTYGALAISNAVFDGNTAGGAYSDNSTFVTVINSQFEHNSTYSYGGGLWIYSSTPVVTITNTDFLSNTASAGGAGLTAGTSGLQIFGGRFENNRSAGTLGGGLYVMGSVDLITGTEFISNSAPVGGGLYAGVSTIMNARFERNTSTSNSGGGLVIAGIGTSAITNTVFVSNSAYCSTLPCYAGGGGINTINPIQLADVNLTGNTAATSGGGLYASDAVTLTNANFISNTASNFGGGLYANGLATVTNSQFLHNSASSGGGMWTGGAVVAGGRFEGNISASGIGGGLSTGPLTMSGTQFVSNMAMCGGGAFAISPVIINGGRFERNTSNDSGGALCLSTLTLTGTEFISNSATINGGAIFYSYTAADPIRDGRIVNALFSQNSATAGGAALFVQAKDNVTLLHATIADTDLQLPSAIAISQGTLHLTNTIIANHAIGISNTGGTVTEDYNLFYGNLTNTAGVITGAHSLVGDPRFVDPAHDDYHLVFGSAAIDRGVDAGVYTDLDGNLRPQGTGFDIGAYEFTGGTRYVATTGDDASNLCLDQLAPCATVQHAIDVANDGEQVLIASGLYTQSLTLSKPVSLTGVNSDTTILHAVAGQRVLTVTGATITNSVVISGLTFTGGRADYGGGLYSDYTVTLINMRFISNTATIGGGALTQAGATISNSQFIENQASPYSGGGFACVNYICALDIANTIFVSNTAGESGGGLYSEAGSITLVGSRFEGNVSHNHGGGLMRLQCCDMIYMTDTQFISNTAVGFYGGGGAFAGPVTISGGRFERNVSTGSGGGGLFGAGTISGTSFISNSANAGGGFYGAGTIINARFEGNQASINDEWLGGGGAIAAGGGETVISRTQFVNNFSAIRGGAVSAQGTNGLKIVDSLFTNNVAPEGTAVGDVSYLGSTGNISLLHVTIANTQLNPTSAVSILSFTAQLTNTIVANHAIGISNTGGTVTEDYNLFYGNGINTVGVTMGAHSLIGDPRFVDPAHDDYHLASGSAAIDRGVDAGVYTDLDGNLRPQGVGFDIGAYEYQGPIYRAYLPVIKR